MSMYIELRQVVRLVFLTLNTLCTIDKVHYAMIMKLVFIKQQRTFRLTEKEFSRKRHITSWFHRIELVIFNVLIFCNRLKRFKNKDIFNIIYHTT